MRKATNITVKRNRIGTNYNNIKLPKQGDILNFGNDGVFQVYNLTVIDKGAGQEACFVLDTMDGNTTITIKICSSKPFRK